MELLLKHTKGPVRVLSHAFTFQTLVGVKKVSSRLLMLAGARWAWEMKQGISPRLYSVVLLTPQLASEILCHLFLNVGNDSQPLNV